MKRELGSDAEEGGREGGSSSSSSSRMRRCQIFGRIGTNSAGAGSPGGIYNKISIFKKKCTGGGNLFFPREGMDRSCMEHSFHLSLSEESGVDCSRRSRVWGIGNNPSAMDLSILLIPRPGEIPIFAIFPCIFHLRDRGICSIRFW